MAAACQPWKHKSTWIIADHKGAFDVTVDVGKVRPIFHVGALGGKPWVRFIIENADTEHYQDARYPYQLLLNDVRVDEYDLTGIHKYDNGDDVVHHAGARLVRIFWPEGRGYPQYDFKQLIADRKLPNFDTSYVIPEAELARQSASWLATDRTPFGDGNWAKYMGGVGGRSDIGIEPTWTVQALYALYSGDPRMWDKAFGNAELFCAFQYHLREGNSTKAGFGGPVRVTDRPSIATVTHGQTKPADRVKVTGPISDGGWKLDAAHAPDPFTALYLVTGDYFYLEESLFWASWLASGLTGPAVNSIKGRGPTGAEGGTPGLQTRAQAWILRMWVEVWNILEDGPDKDYFAQLINDWIAVAEGQRGIDSPRKDNACWAWGNKWLFTPTLHIWDQGAKVSDMVDPARASSAFTPFMQNFLIIVLGRAKELGFDTGRLLEYAGSVLVAQVTNPACTPFMTAFYKMPALTPQGAFFKTWAEMMTAYKAADIAGVEKLFHSQVFQQDLTEHGYAYIAMAASAMLGGPTWEWLHTNVGSSPHLVKNPKWFIKPR